VTDHSAHHGLVNLFDVERLAAERLPQMALDYYAGGALDEVTLRGTRDAFDRIAIWYRTLVDVSRRSTATTVLGTPISLPVMIAPTAFHAMAHPDGECATARAAGKAGTIMMVSTLSNTGVEDIAAAATGPLWFLLYIYKDRVATRDLIARAEAAGCRAIVLTVDAPIMGPRERDVRNRFTLPDGLKVMNLTGAGQGDVGKEQAGSGLNTYVSTYMDPALTWRELEWLRGATTLPVVVKGIARADDARRAAEAGVQGIVVSNHGGRQLDTAPATIDALPYVADAVAGRCEVYLDGGVRRGIDVVKAVARGARAVMIGRPVLWGLVVDGEHGVARVLEILRGELDSALALCGCPTIDDIDPGLLQPDA
jgi:4-hydroxymandelate oxidase